MSALLVGVIAVAEEHHEQVINPWIVGGIAMAILIGMLLGLMAFGGGREHS